MRFSVIIPMYNAERTIVRALESVERQTATDAIVEIIVVDDGSTDRGRRLVEEFKNAKREIDLKVISQENSGVASARNAGIYQAKEEWIALLDADDEWLLEKIEVQRKLLKGHPEIDLLGCEINDFPVNLYYRKLTSLSEISIPDLLIKIFPQTSTLVFRREVFDAVGGFNEAMSHGEDGRFLMDAVSKFNCYYFPKKLVQYDGGKAGFGAAGLSSNIFAMRESEKLNLMYLLEKRYIGRIVFLLASLFAFGKFLRRVVIRRAK